MDVRLSLLLSGLAGTVITPETIRGRPLRFLAPPPVERTQYPGRELSRLLGDL